MGSNKTFTIVGGDKRMIYLANILSQNFNTGTYGINSSDLSENVKIYKDMESAINSADIVIGPLPYSSDGEYVNCSYFDEKVSVDEVFKLMNSKQIFIAGFINDKVKQTANMYHIDVYDYFEREELVVLNCIPTAEGAIQIAMQETPYTIHQSNCLILGFGRIGKILAKMLVGIGANVDVEARKHSDLAWIESYGYRGIPLDKLAENLYKYDLIFNTIPSVILDEELLKKLKKDCFIIDLASKPGGVDFEAAKQLGVKTNWALALPGKVAPYTAANIIKTAILNIIDELGV